MKHTPGPWRTGSDGHNVLSDSRGDRPCLLASVYHVEDMGQRDHTETHANARLIAAAPELLNACRAFLFQVIQGPVLERDAVVAQARAAIAKAIGDQS